MKSIHTFWKILYATFFKIQECDEFPILFQIHVSRRSLSQLFSGSQSLRSCYQKKRSGHAGRSKKRCQRVGALLLRNFGEFSTFMLLFVVFGRKVCEEYRFYKNFLLESFCRNPPDVNRNSTRNSLIKLNVLNVFKRLEDIKSIKNRVRRS